MATDAPPHRKTKIPIAVGKARCKYLFSTIAPVERELENSSDFPKSCYAKIHASEEIPIGEIV